MQEYNYDILIPDLLKLTTINSIAYTPVLGKVMQYKDGLVRSTEKSWEQLLAAVDMAHTKKQIGRSAYLQVRDILIRQQEKEASKVTSLKTTKAEIA